MENGRSSLDEILEDLIKTQVECLCLDSLDLEEIPVNLFKQLESKAYLTILKLEYNDLSSLPNELGLLSSLEKLYLTGNQLGSLPNTINGLNNLRELHMNENTIKSLPDTFCELHNLEILNLIGNSLEIWNESHGEGLRSLKELRLGENNLHYLPESFSHLQNLRVLEINDNKLKKLPEMIGDLFYLEVLNLNQNKLEDLPDSFGQLSCLRSVDISENRVKSLPSELKSAERLQHFYAVNNLIKVLPPWFANLHSIIELNLSDNELTDMALPPEFCPASGKTLGSLDLSGNKMTALPVTMGHLEKLTIFHLGSTICELERRAFQNGNWLKELPKSFTQMSSLVKLHLDENQLICLPDSFGELVSLEWLDVSQNRIDHLPNSFCSLKKLWFCQFSKNNIRELPENFGDLSSLMELKLDSNDLRALPNSFENLQNLETLDLFCNQLKKIPKVLLKLKNLQRLDMDGNPLRIKADKVPKLTTTVRYASRNPELEQNWRGKARIDKKDFYGTERGQEENISSLIEKAELEDNLENDISELSEEMVYNERALELAMRRGLSIWKSHTGPETRQEDSEYARHFQNLAPLSPEKTFTFQRCQDQWDIFEDAAPPDETPASFQQQHNDNLQDAAEEAEDWDREAEELWRDKYFSPNGLHLKHSLQHVPIRDQLQDVISSYPPANQAYTQSAKYDSVYMKYHQNAAPKETMMGPRIVEIDNSGQFEDAEI